MPALAPWHTGRVSKKRKGRLGFPRQPCGLSYKDFRSGWTYADAYEHVAYGRGEGPRTITQRTVLRELNALKRAEFERYQANCDASAPSHKRSSDCDRVCRVKSKPCGKSCISKARSCRKPVADRVCSIDDFQSSFDFDKKSAPEYDSSEFLDGLRGPVAGARGSRPRRRARVLGKGSRAGRSARRA